jgi:hypothetical protein
MEDRELVEMAAKAAGIVGTWHRSGFVAYSGWGGGLFNPLTDDGDALRLAVKMGIYVHCGAGSMVTSAIGDGDEWVIENWSNDPTSATRRAITRAAAQIGKEIE